MAHLKVARNLLFRETLVDESRRVHTSSVAVRTVLERAVRIQVLPFWVAAEFGCSTNAEGQWYNLGRSHNETQLCHGVKVATEYINY